MAHMPSIQQNQTYIIKIFQVYRVQLQRTYHIPNKAQNPEHIFAFRVLDTTCLL